MNDAGRLQRAGIVAALVHGLVIYLAAIAPPRSQDGTTPPDSPINAVIPVEVWLDVPPPPVERREATTDTPALEPAPASAAGATRGEPAHPAHGGKRNGPEAETGTGPPGPIDPSEGFSPLDGERRDPPGIPRLRLSDVVDMAPEGPPAPTRPPPPQRVVTADDTNEAVRSLVRDEDKKLGLGNPQETAIAAAVQEAGRASGVPSGTRFVVSIVLDGDGNVTDASIRGDTAGDGAWSSTLAAIRGKLQKPVPLGIDERGRGARVIVNATLLHVFPSGSDKSVVMGDCPKLPLIGGEQAPHFMNIGGEQYLEPPNGLCALSDGDFKDSSKTIVVRTTVKTHHAREAPPALSSFPPRPRPKKLLPTPMELIMRAINGK